MGREMISSRRINSSSKLGVLHQPKMRLERYEDVQDVIGLSLYLHLQTNTLLMWATQTLDDAYA